MRPSYAKTLTTGKPAFGADFAPLYDAAGNLTKDSQFKLYYDYVNRLTKVESALAHANYPIKVADYRYDAFGRRVESKLYDHTWNGSANVEQSSYVRFYHDRQRVLEERDGSGNTLRHAVWGDYIDELLMLDVNKDADTDPTEGTDARYYALSNTQYSVHAMLNDAGAIQELYNYTPYGQVEIRAPLAAQTYFYQRTPLPLRKSAIGNPHLYTGRYLDTETGNYHYRARYYTPHLARFTSRDPLGYPDGMNGQEYVRSQPTTGRDPFGHQAAIVRPPNPEAEKQVGRLIKQLGNDDPRTREDAQSELEKLI